MTNRTTPGSPSIEPPTEPRDYVAMALAYARAAVAGEIVVCKWVRLACRRQLDDLIAEATGRFPYRFDRAKAARVCAFVERLPHIKGELAKRRELIRLEPWQCFILTTCFGWLRDNGTRRFWRAYNEVARKNAKSTLSSGVGLYMMAADGEEGAEIYALAKKLEQAGIVFRDAQAMVRKSPGLQRRFGIEPTANAIVRMATSSKFEALPGKPGDGQNPSCAIVDEYHEHATSEAYDAMETGMGARSQPLMWVITTAGFNRAGPCFALRIYAQKVLDGRIEDDSLFAIIFTLDDEDDWTDPAVWAKANPNLGISVDAEKLGEQCRAAQHDATKQVTFKTKRLNIWVNAGTTWMDMRDWDAAADPSLAWDGLRGRRAWVGLDLASKEDVAALLVMVELGADGPGRYAVFGRYYLPREPVEAGAHSTHAHYAKWDEEGWLTLTSGNIIDFGVIKRDLLEVCAFLDVQSVGYDPHQATQFATECLEEGLPMVEVRQAILILSEPMKQVRADVKAGHLRHTGDPVLGWMMSNVVAYVDNKENIYPRKHVPENKIDGVVALIIARARAMAVELKEVPATAASIFGGLA